MAGRRVWLISDRKGRVRAVGAGERATPYAPLGPELDHRRDKHGTVRVSVDQFTTAADARMAAAIVARAIDLATDADPGVHVDDDVAGGTRLEPLLPTRRKVLHYRDLERALVVRVALDDLIVDGRLVSGRRHPKKAAKVVRGTWPLGRVLDQDLTIRRLVAVTDAEVDPPRVIGIWKVRDHARWIDHGDGDISVGLKKAKKGDRGGHVGRRFDWDGYQASQFGYSHDIRVEAGLVAADTEATED